MHCKRTKKMLLWKVSHELTTLSITRTEDGKKKNKGEQKREQSDNVAFGAGMFVNGFGLQLIYKEDTRTRKRTSQYLWRVKWQCGFVPSFGI